MGLLGDVPHRGVGGIPARGDDLADELIDAESRRYAPLCTILRTRFARDIDCWGQARGQPIKPGTILQVMRRKISEGAKR